MKFLKWTFLSVLLIMSKANNSIAWRTSRSGDVLFVYDVLIENQSDPANLKFSNIDIVQLKRPKISTLTVDMQSQITNVRRFELSHGSVPTVHVAQHFKEYSFWNCSVKEVILNPNVTYSLEELAIFNNKLEKLPKNLNALKNLKYLYLHDNEIEFVNINDLNGLNKLENINLDRNKIIKISATSVILPSLLYFSVDDSRLSSINFEHWNTVSLKKIWLSRNRLSIALAIQNVFPRLEAVALDGNPFYCEWLNATLKELKARRVTISNEALTTCSKEAEVLDEFRKIKFQNTFATNQEMQNTNNKLDRSAQSFKTLQDSFNQFEKYQQQKLRKLENSNLEYDKFQKSQQQVNSQLEKSISVFNQFQKSQQQKISELEKFYLKYDQFQKFQQEKNSQLQKSQQQINSDLEKSNQEYSKSLKSQQQKISVLEKANLEYNQSQQQKIRELEKSNVDFHQSLKSQQQKISALEKANLENNQSQQQKISELEKSIQQLQSVVLAEIDQLKHKDADLTEALYLHEIEAEHSPINRKDASEAGASPLGP